MESSRIFIKGLPPSITEADFKKHFSSGGREVTDAIMEEIAALSGQEKAGWGTSPGSGT